MRKNPLIDPIESILDAQKTTLSEYALMQQLQAQGWLASIDASDTLSLYSTHFLIYNALYQLRNHYSQSQQYLRISALDIGLTDTNSDTVSLRSEVSYSIDQGYHEASSELQDYYLDWANVDSATRESVDGLLDSFWSRYVEEDELSTALDMLGVIKQASYVECKRAYRKLAMRHHPDRGGSEQQFQNIQRAFSTIQRHFGINK
ncbi:DNA-J related domain-containing protein [Eionea flava]